MDEIYLAYFDYLGFKEFIENNDEVVISRRMRHIFRDTEGALGQGKYKEPKNGVILSDISNTKINCLNISDTVMFWTNDCELDSLIELIKISYEFNWTQNGYNFPVRGSLVKGKIELVSGVHNNSNGGSYNVQCLYGKGLIKAHLKAESQNWAGTVIDNSVVQDLSKNKEGFNILNDHAVKYKVPYKTGIEENEEYVFRIAKGITNKTALENVKQSIIDVFKMDNKSVEAESVQLKIQNTVTFIDSLVE